MQRYLQPHTLKAMGLMNFDSWATTFGETVTALEIAPEGKGYRAKTRFAKFNLNYSRQCLVIVSTPENH